MARRHYAGRRGRHVEAKERHASANDVSGVRTRAGEEEHVGDAVLIPRSIFAKNKHRAMRTIPDDSYAGPEIDGPRNPVTALWNEDDRSEEHTSELQSLRHLVCRLLLEKK